MKTHRFTVEGKFRFPLDMLRYDQAVPMTKDDILVINEATEQSPPMVMRKVTLRSYAAHGPTVGRWASFNWRVIASAKE